MKRTVFLLMILTIFSKVVGFTRDLSLSYFYGASNISDAYLISLTIPAVIFGFIGAGISTGYIPMYSKIESNIGAEEGNRYTNNLINIILLICSIIIVVGLIFTGPIIKLFASGFEKETLDLTIKFTRISIFGVYFTGIIYIFNGFLQIKGNYHMPALIGFPLNFFMILSIVISSKTNVLVLSMGSVIAILSQLVLLLPFIHQKGYRHRMIMDFKDEHVRNMAYITLPVIIGTSVNQINTLVDRTLASQQAVGAISALNYANKLNGFVQGIFVASIATALYPRISKMAAENNIFGLKKSVSEAIRGVTLLVIPATVGFMILAEPIVNLLFRRGAFDAQAVSMTSYALFFYSFGMVAVGLRQVLFRVFYSLQDTKTPMTNAAIGVITNIVLNIILSKYLGIGGLALATSISAGVCTLLLFIRLRKKIGSFGIKSIMISFLKVLTASMIMGLLTKSLYNRLLDHLSANVSLLCSIGIGAMIYFIIIYFMKLEEMNDIINLIKRKIKKNHEQIPE